MSELAQLVLALMVAGIPVLVPAMLWRLLRISRVEPAGGANEADPLRYLCASCHRVSDETREEPGGDPFRNAAPGQAVDGVCTCPHCGERRYRLSLDVARDLLAQLEVRRLRFNGYRCGALFTVAWFCAISGLSRLAADPVYLGFTTITAVATMAWAFCPRRYAPLWWVPPLGSAD